jgi:uncharacterized membrane protein YphA (DoxX/SURF4 family)
MNIALWIAQVLLAFAFLTTGLLKLRQPRETLATTMGWVEDFSDGFVKFVGGVEVLGALGLVFPSLFDIAPILTPIAAVGLALAQAIAVVVHLRRKEPQVIPSNLVLIAIAVFIAWGRFGDYSL